MILSRPASICGCQPFALVTSTKLFWSEAPPQTWIIAPTRTPRECA